MRIPIIITCAMLALALAPSASAVPEQLYCPLEMDDGSNILRVGDGGGEACSDDCNGVTILVANPSACEGGCTGITIILASPDSCVADRGKGCEGVTVIDPASSGSCVGGTGQALLSSVA